MRRTMLLGIALLGLAPTVGGCDVLTALLQATSVTVSLVNNGDFRVDVTLIYDNDQDTLDFLLEETGTTLDFTVEAGETVSFTRSCDDLQAILIEDADLRVLSGVGPETNSDLLRDGDEFGCGDTIVFTFDHSDLILDFDVTVSVTESS